MSAQIPDVDMVLHFPDLPGLPAPQQGEIAAAPPVFVTCTNANFLDIPFPDWTWWGTAVRRTSNISPIAAVFWTI